VGERATLDGIRVPTSRIYSINAQALCTTKDTPCAGVLRDGALPESPSRKPRKEAQP
jgi:hypothetical protein